MKNNFLILKNKYKKINKNKHINHILLQNNYSDLCMNFFADKYNTLVEQKLAQDSVIVSLEAENLFVDWLNKE